MDPEILRRISALETKLDIEFNDKFLLIQALTHRSYLYENSNHPTGHYERLEFFGDVVLELVVTEFLYKKYPKATEGELTKRRSALVQAESFAAIANKLNLHQYAFFGKSYKSDNQENKKAKDRTGECLFEAIIGALYLDQGMGACRVLIDFFLLNYTSAIIAESVDYKSLYQDFAQAKYSLTPRYRTISSTGPAHKQVHTVICRLGNREVARADGGSKKEAEKAAAKLAYEQRSQ